MERPSEERCRLRMILDALTASWCSAAHAWEKKDRSCERSGDIRAATQCTAGVCYGVTGALACRIWGWEHEVG